MSAGYNFPWYDSDWLSCYWQGHALVKANASQRLAEYEQHFQPLYTQPSFRTRELQNILDEAQLAEIKQHIAAQSSTVLEKQELLSFGRTVQHSMPLFNELQHALCDAVSELAGEALEPTYNFLSLYNNLGVCEVHLDAPQSKWTLDICIEQSGEWPIHIADPQPWPEPAPFGAGWAEDIKAGNNFQPHVLRPGNAVLFSGSGQWHYRDRIPRLASNNYCHLLFLHYCVKGTAELYQPNTWAESFDMPFLSQIEYVAPIAEYSFNVRPS